MPGHAGPAGPAGPAGHTGHAGHAGLSIKYRCFQQSIGSSHAHDQIKSSMRFVAPFREPIPADSS